MTQPDETVVRVLGERDGWRFENYRHTPIHDCAVFTLYHGEKWIGERVWEGAYKSGLPKYLTSLDAIRPLLAKMTEAEWAKLLEKLLDCCACERNVMRPDIFSRFLLTLEPNLLARAVAFAILACRKEGVA